jgi:hypothetical protein
MPYSQAVKVGNTVRHRIIEGEFLKYEAVIGVIQHKNYWIISLS